MIQQIFFVEIGTEELPPKSLRSLAESFARNFGEELKKLNISHGKISWFATPRRLALKIFDLCLSKYDCKIEKRGPAVSKAFNKDGSLSKEAVAWANNHNISIDKIERLRTEKGEWLYYRTKTKEKNISKLFVSVVTNSLLNLPFSKLMRWSNHNMQFIRPVHTVTMLFGNHLIDGKIFGINSKRIIRGHRFIGKSELIIDSADQYPAILYKYGMVIADYEERKNVIIYNIKKAAKLLGCEIDLRTDDLLIEEVTSLVEWPVILTAKFEKKFLEIPLEILVFIFKKYQRYFFIYDKIGNLMPNFIFVINIESINTEEIIFENEKIARQRLIDIEFFFKNDSRYNLEYNLQRLKMVLFQKQLGTLYEKTFRIKVLSRLIAKKIGANIYQVDRASVLSKCDLLTNMVFEYTDMQGIIGMHYALRDGEIKDVALALKEQYQPKFFNDELPSTKVSSALAIAEKIDTLIGIFGIGYYPKSNRDPFALRRNTFGILRIIIEKRYDINLIDIIQESVYLYGDKLTNCNVVNDVIKFMFDRLSVWYQELGYNLNIIQSVLNCYPTNLYDFNERVKAVNCFNSSKEGKNLIKINKRVSNILNKSKTKLFDNVLISEFKTPQEVKIAISIIVIQIKLVPIIINKNYKEALIQLSSLCESIDDFFKNVKVMDENQTVRINRLNLLKQLRDLFLKVADISLLQ
ncbi:Glycine--tRNA ligase beta subunit [Candidatus Providencia siddallii]|uniref:Glycine--tRNA ligase beta subunit n=1 Tax=Candidatus Providencia siddallii TaxID=1715285 RepID=A0A0M6W8F6_9GAMM|nr:Glycine--tRNA ligase beta subunit [Candidatus Providencia siddallii]